MARDNGGPAFPSGALDVVANRVASSIYDGMTLRDYFAAAALTGLLLQHEGDPALRAEKAYRYADAMLAERADP